MCAAPASSETRSDQPVTVAPPRTCSQSAAANVTANRAACAGTWYLSSSALTSACTSSRNAVAFTSGRRGVVVPGDLGCVRVGGALRGEQCRVGQRRPECAGERARVEGDRGGDGAVGLDRGQDRGVLGGADRGARNAGGDVVRERPGVGDVPVQRAGQGPDLGAAGDVVQDHVALLVWWSGAGREAGWVFSGL